MPSKSSNSHNYPVYQYTDGSSSYEEYDLNTAAQELEVGPSNPTTRPRSAYSSPPPPPTRYSGSRNRQSLEAYMYDGRRPTAPSSAPSRYDEYPRRESRYRQDEHAAGRYAAMYDDANANYWYAGPPTSEGHSSYGWQECEFMRHPSSRASDVTRMYDGEFPPELFDVSAPHHAPGHRARDARLTTPLPGFANWSRTWYDGHLSANGHAYTTVRPPTRASGWEADTDAFSSRDYSSGRNSKTHSKDRVKEERMRMLEKEFGKPKITHSGEEGDSAEEKSIYDDEDSDNDVPVGGMTSTGNFVTERPRLELTLRVFIILTAVATVGCGIGGAILVKPGDKPPAAKGSMPSYVLYVVSVISLAIIAYSYIFRACCCNPVRKELKGQGGAGLNTPMAGMVIPVLSGQAPGKSSKGFRFGRGKKGRMGMLQPMQPPTVNLIVNPEMFGGQRTKRHDDPEDGSSDDDSETERLPGDARRSKKRRKRLSVMDQMQLQRRWQVARKELKIRTGLDVLLLIAWIGCSIITLALGKSKSCPSGAGNGWCTYYHAAIACGIVQAVWLLGALYCNFRNLSVSQHPPRAL